MPESRKNGVDRVMASRWARERGSKGRQNIKVLLSRKCNLYLLKIERGIVKQGISVLTFAYAFPDLRPVKKKYILPNKTVIYFFL